MPRARKPTALTQRTPPEGPVTIELFATYSAALAASGGIQSVAEQILAVPRIDGPEQQQWAADRGGEVSDLLKQAEARQSEDLAPIKKLAATVKGYTQPDIDALEKAKAHLKTLIREDRERCAAAQAELLAHATSASERIAAVAALGPKPAGYGEAETWGWEIADLAAIPPAYFVLDEARLTREAKQHKAALAVPGIRPVRGTISRFT